MTFFWPHMLWLLVMVPVLVYLYIFLLRRKRKNAVRYASLDLVKEAMGPGPGFRRHIPPILLLIALTMMFIAIARPAAQVTLPTGRDTVILAMDVSGSMRASDVEPDRITAAQTAAKEFVSEQPANTRIGIVAFAGTAMLVQQPSRDRDEIIAAIERFQLHRGTNLGDAILVSLLALFPDSDLDLGPRDSRTRFRRGAPLGEALPDEDFVPVEPGSYTNAAIVLLTDGRPTTGPDPVNSARAAADRGVRVFTVGFGTAEGVSLSFGGRSMRVQLDEELLRQIAEITRGRYFHAGSATDLSGVYRELTTELVMETEQTEITAFLSAISALLVLVSASLSLLWFGRIL